MYIEKYKLIGIEEEEELTDIIKNDNSTYPQTNKMEFGISFDLIKQYENKLFIPYHEPFYTKEEVIEYLETIRYQYNNVIHWFILPELIDIPLEEARRLKINNIQQEI